jgi:membrane fusion protein (multidrug efflux system)
MQRTKISTARIERPEEQPEPVVTSEVASTAAPAAPAAPDKRRTRRILFALGPAVILLISGALYFGGGRYVNTDNAYIKANKVTVSLEVGGPILAVSVRENQQVRAGDELFRIDEQPFRIALERAEAQLRTVQSDIAGLKASYRQKGEQLRLAKSNVDFAARELARQSQLAQRKLVSQVKLDESQHNFDTARDQLGVLEQEQAQTLTQLAGNAEIAAEKHPRYLQAKADRDSAALNLQRTVVRAPFAGVTSKVPQVGQYVSAGGAVMSVIATDDLWIEANFMETDLANVRPGQPVAVHVDTYANRDWEGTVQSIAQATGAEFSVLPPQNASGNWVKVVQRIPVRIAIKANRDDPPLRVGMTAGVKIDTGKHHTVAALLHLSNDNEQAGH